MHVNVQIDSGIPPFVSERVSELVQEKLVKHATFVQEASVTISKVNGHRGGLAYRCRMVISPSVVKDIVIQETAENIGKIVGRALQRADYTLSKKRQRRFSKPIRLHRRSLQSHSLS